MDALHSYSHYTQDRASFPSSTHCSFHALLRGIYFPWREAGLDFPSSSGCRTLLGQRVHTSLAIGTRKDHLLVPDCWHRRKLRAQPPRNACLEVAQSASAAREDFDEPSQHSHPSSYRQGFFLLLLLRQLPCFASFSRRLLLLVRCVAGHQYPVRDTELRVNHHFSNAWLFPRSLVRCPPGRPIDVRQSDGPAVQRPLLPDEGPKRGSRLAASRKGRGQGG